jgi:hypothetical protein
MRALRTHRSIVRLVVHIGLICGLALAATQPGYAQDVIKVKVFIGAMFEIGKNTGDRAGEFQHWYERYWMKDAKRSSFAHARIGPRDEPSRRGQFRSRQSERDDAAAS